MTATLRILDEPDTDDAAWLAADGDIVPRGYTPAGAWRPPTPPLRGPAIACVHGYRGECAHYAPDSPEWADPRTWRPHVTGPFRLERVADWSTAATGEVIARWGEDGPELRTVEPPEEVVVRTPHGSTLATSPHAVTGADGVTRAQYVIAPTGWRALLREALAEAVERRRVGTLDALRALWGGR